MITCGTVGTPSSSYLFVSNISVMNAQRVSIPYPIASFTDVPVKASRLVTASEEAEEPTP